MSGMFSSYLLEVVQIVILLAAAPVFIWWVRTLKCWFQGRTTAGIFQTYRDFIKLFHKDIVLAENASWIFRITPYLIFGFTVLIGAIIPVLSVDLPLSSTADVIAIVSLFAMSRFFTALAGMDIGTAFGGMGSSREMTIASLTEPAMLMAVFTVAMIASTTNLSVVIEHNLHAGLVMRPSLLFALLGLAMVAAAETGRVPVDHP